MHRTIRVIAGQLRGDDEGIAPIDKFDDELVDGLNRCSETSVCGLDDPLATLQDSVGYRVHEHLLAFVAHG